MDRRTFLLGAAAVSTLAAGGAQAQGAWMRLGSRTVRWRSSRESIMVSRTGPISQLQFRSRGAPIFITSVDVIFDRGSERLQLHDQLRSHFPSRTLRLRNRDRSIRRVEFSFRRRHNTPTASTTVEVFGRR